MAEVLKEYEENMRVMTLERKVRTIKEGLKYHAKGSFTYRAATELFLSHILSILS